MIALIVLGLLLVILGVIGFRVAESTGEAVFCFIASFFGVVLFAIGVAPKYKQPKEYPASEYTLEIKVTEFQGQRDTTYVLIPKY